MKMFAIVTGILFLTLTFTNCRNKPSETHATKDSYSTHLQTNIYIPDSNTLGVLKYEHSTLPGYILFAIHKNTYLIDRCGRVVNKWTSDYEVGGAFQLLEDGSLLRAGKLENEYIDFPGIGGIIEKFSWEGRKTWSFTLSDSTRTQHHGLLYLPNGNIAMTAVRRTTLDQAISAGRNPESIADGELYDQQIIEIKPEGTNRGEIVWEWHSWDHLIQEFDPTKENFGVIAENPHRLDLNFLGISNGASDWLHLNSIAFNEELDQIMVSSQKLSEIYIIDHSTTTEEAASSAGGRSGKGGDLLFRWGNPYSYGLDKMKDRRLYGQHAAHWIPEGLKDEGKILIFNNGLGRKSRYSSLDIIAPKISPNNVYNFSNQLGFLPPEPEWTYVKKADTMAFYSKIMSNAQRLPNGHTLICEGTKGKIFEIDESGEVVWEYVNPVTTTGEILAQGENTQSHLFMALYYGYDFPGIKDKKLQPEKPIELNSNIGNCK